MTNTPRANLPELAASQAQKHVTHNDALLQLDALIDLYVISNALTAPPGSPSDGDIYIVGASATGAWSGHDGKIAYCVDGAWRFYAPFKGLLAYVLNATDFLFYNGSSWVSFSSLMMLQNLAMLGVNTTADSTNKLAVKSSALLFDNIGNGVQVKLNKNAAADTASFLYQKAYSGRAEIGLMGDDNFHFKVSPDGSTWYGAINIDRTTGNVGVLNSSPAQALDITGSVKYSAQLLSASGSAGAPAISFSGDSDTGLWNPAANTLAWSANGAEWMRLTSAGNLYMNTTSAIESVSYSGTGVAQLQVKGTAVIGRASSYPVRIHGDGWQSLEFPPQSSGGFGFNCYYNGTNIIYRTTDYAFRGFLDGSGNFRELSAASGTAGATISFVESRRVTSAGHTLLSTTVDNGVLTVGGNVMPEADNTRNIGSSSFRFANGFFGGYVRSGSYTVGTLPSAATAGAGARAFVTDANATTFASTVAGGGANKVPVTSDGTNWIIG